MSELTMKQAYELYFGLPWGESDLEQAHWEACWKAAREAGMAERDRLQAEVERLQHFKAAYMEWSDKTEWARLDSTKGEWGKHLADVIKMRFDQLKAEVETLRKALTDCSDSLHAEMLQKFGGQLPGDMHPVTRRDYDRDMAEVAGYRTAIGGVEPDLDTLREEAGQ